MRAVADSKPSLIDYSEVRYLGLADRAVESVGGLRTFIADVRYLGRSVIGSWATLHLLWTASGQQETSSTDVDFVSFGFMSGRRHQLLVWLVRHVQVNVAERSGISWD
jgi:hypothetical protein